MLDNGHNKCPYTDEIVSYMYDEIGGADSGTFESHLAACSACTDEFAAIANARFSVYEWHKEEFAHLPTPEFVIPYNARPEPVPGIFASLRELLAFGNWPVTAAAVLAIIIGAAFFGMTYLRSNDQPTIADVAPAETIVPVKAEAPVPVAVTLPSNDRAVTTPRNVALTKAAEKRTANQDRKVSPQRVVAERKTGTPKAPVLAETDDDADTTLRLTDLFDGIGG